jgi:hypothetical protein
MTHVETSFEIDLRNFDVEGLCEQSKDFNRKKRFFDMYPSISVFVAVPLIAKLQVSILFRQQHVSLSRQCYRAKQKIAL